MKQELQGLEETEFAHIYSLPLSQNISKSALYKENKMYGIDIGSALSVLYLDPQQNDNILDLCCSPGTKLLFIADLVSQGNPQYTQSAIVGNEISEHRLNITKSLLKRYGNEFVRLTNRDALLLDRSDFDFSFDKVIADVECSHDGSFKHILKYCNPIPAKKKKETNLEHLSQKALKRRAR